MRILRFVLVALALMIALPAAAQDEDKSYLTQKIQELLSGSGRQVDIVGFTGALSSQASFQKMTIADDDGVWLSMEDVVLSWNRTALLGGRLVVEELSAASIDIPRLPTSEAAALPTAEATPFTFPSLPELPVSIDIDALKIAKLRVGAPILGEALEVQMNAKARLDDDGLDIAFQSSRTDGKRGSFDLTAKLTRGEDVLDLLLKLSEQADGLASNLLNIPNNPSIDLIVKANGPVDDLVTNLKIDTDGKERLAGDITLVTSGDAADPDRRITADIHGDITAVILAEYRDFFGTKVSLTADALIEAGGAVSVDAFALKAAEVDLQGRVHLSEDKWPSLIAIAGTVARADGKAVLLPGGGGSTFVDRIALNVDYDVQNGEAYEAQFEISGLKTDEAEVAQTTLRSTGTLVGALGNVGQLRGTVQFAAQGVALVDAALAEALGTEINGSTEINYVEDKPFRISNLDLHGTDYELKGDAQFSGVDTGLRTTLDTTLAATDISRFSALAGRELDGATSLALKGSVTPLSGEFTLDAKGTADDIKTGIIQADALLEGRTDLTMTAIRNVNGTFLRGLELNNAAMLFTGGAELYSASSRIDADVILRDIATVLPQYEGRVALKGHATQRDAGWFVDVDADGPYDVALALDGLVTGSNAALEFSARVPEVSPFAEGINGPLNADGTLRQTPQGWLLQTDATGPYNASATVNGLVTPTVNIGFDLSMPQVSALVPQVNGPLRATGRLVQSETGFEIQTDASGPYNSKVSATGTLTPALDLKFDASVPNVQPLVPQVSGPLRATGELRQIDGIIFVDTTATGPYSSRASLRGDVTGPNANVDFTLAMPNVGAIVPKLTGPLSVSGNADKTSQGWQLDTSLTGPAGTQGTLAGLVADNGTHNLALKGNAPLGLAGPFIAPRVLQGQARFDLALNGPAGLSALSGTIQTSGATLSAPNYRVGLEGINADVRLANNRANLDISANAIGGGRLTVTGGVGLGGALPADIDIGLQEIILADPRLYRTSLSGALRLSGPLSGGAAISGGITIGETNVTVPSTGLTSIGEIPLIDHVGAPAANLATRRRAGLLEEGATSDPTDSGTSSAGFGLDILVKAPGRIYVRGRGLDAELGGNLKISGDTNNILSSGKFELERGRLDILGKRFDLEEGTATFEGDFIPYIRFVSTTSTDDGSVSVIVEGPADEPKVTFESTPDGPQDEVLSQLLFGRNLSEISAFQALQLANAVAILAGKGGANLTGNLRDRFGLDDLDVTTTDSGATAVSAGKYLSDNIYSDVTAVSDGSSEVSLNIDLTPNLKGKASLGSDGDSSIGIFFEKDY